jgi:hypothetical protein
MSDLYPTWYNVLQHFDNNGYFHNGLTLPFLIGASSTIYPVLPLITINAFW